MTGRSGEERQWLAAALAEIADLLYDVWRTNTDEERAALGSRVGAALDAYQKHPSRLVADAETAVKGLPEHRLLSWVESSVKGFGSCACGEEFVTDGYEGSDSLAEQWARHIGSNRRGDAR